MGLARDVGSIVVIEHDGSSYDWKHPDGTPNYEARYPVAQRFYETHGDLYDFLVVFTNFEFETGDAQAFHNLVSNEVKGIGKPLFSLADAFGSAGRLKGYVDMAAVSRYRSPPYGLQPGTPGFRVTLGVLGHEVGHQWLADARYQPGAGPASRDLLRSDSHWSYLHDTDASLMFGADWTAEGDAYRATKVMQVYSALDLYLMGLLGESKVSSFTLLRNPAISPDKRNVEGDLIQGEPEAVALSQVIAAEGPRVPGALASQKEFRLGFIFLSAPGTEPSAQDLEDVEAVRSAFAGHFFALTRGVAVADTSLAESPPVLPAPLPDLERAVEWLLSRQSLDGSWSDAPPTAIRDTAAAVQALQRLVPGALPLQAALGWLRARSPYSVDFTTRRALGLSAFSLPPADRKDLVEGILRLQNADGGFGAGPDLESDALDTALALQALKALGFPPGPAATRAVEALAALRGDDGGWAAAAGAPTSVVVTAQVLLALHDWSELPPAPELIPGGLAALLAHRNPDGGFGESPSTPFATALALDVLARAGAPADVTSLAVSWLQQRQLQDGSWNGSPFETALVLSALKAGLGANLRIPMDSLVLSNPQPEEGEVVEVTAKLRNDGRTEAGASTVSLHVDDPTSPPLSEASLGPLAPGAEVEVTLPFPTAGRPGQRTLFVRADAHGEVAESREDDNVASRSLRVGGPLPNFSLSPADVVMTPVLPEEGEAALVSVTVRNLGLRASGASVLQVGLDDSVLLAQLPVPTLDPGQATTVSFEWDTTGKAGRHTLAFVTDATFTVEEEDELDNEARIQVTVAPPGPPGPELTLSAFSLEPSKLTTLPAVVEARVTVTNRGHSPAVSSLVVRDLAAPGVTLAEQALDLPARGEASFVLPLSIATPGTRVFEAVANPDHVPAEDTYDDNARTAKLLDPGNTIDLVITPADVVASATEVVVGERVDFAVTVRNRGTAGVPSVRLLLARRVGAALFELDRRTLSVPAGGSTDASLHWTTSVTGDPVELVVKVDPQNTIPELSDANNEAAVALTVLPSIESNLTLDASSIAFDPSPPLEGQPATISAVVRNTSSVPAGSSSVRFYRGDPDAGGMAIATVPIPALDPGAETTAVASWSPVDTRGAQGVFVVADALGEVTEYDETDNRAFRPFRAVGLADLVLAAADVALVPAYPHEGEAVVLEATVRNLGEQPSAAASLAAYEGEPLVGLLIAQAGVPELPPGGSLTLSFSWTASPPPGSRTLSFVVDPESAVSEQDEGNNTVRRRVLVQDADLFLSDPVFSPDGDGVKDVTVLGYRATGEVTAVVSDAQGRAVRALATGAPPEGSLPWDGRSDLGTLVRDGSYRITLTGEGGATLGRIEVVVDTNRSAIHEAAGTGRTAVVNLTCRLPETLPGPAFTAAEDAALFVVDRTEPGFPPGLLRVGLDGSYEYLFQDEWWSGARFPATRHARWGYADYLYDAVSSDGAHVLVVKSGQLFVIDLADGSRQQVATAEAAAWSPDGQWIHVPGQVLSRTGDVVGSLGATGGSVFDLWTWAPTSDRLAREGRVRARDGTPLGSFLEEDLPIHFGTLWREDGKIVTRLSACQDDSCEAPWRTFLIDPDAASVVELEGAEAEVALGYWSPDSTRVLWEGRVYRADGTTPIEIFPLTVKATPRSGHAYADWVDLPGTCPGHATDTFLVANLLNLSAGLEATRLTGNAGVLLRGVASDKHLDHYQLDFAEAGSPGVWHPIGAASDVPVLGKAFTAWLPPGPGSYLLRLRAFDEAGHVLSRTRAASWDRVPPFANVTQTEFLFSPNGDGVRDTVTFNYTVLEPLRLEVRIEGPQDLAHPDAPAPTVRSFGLDYPATGPGSFVWEGRNDAGVPVPDGRYTVRLDGVPFEVEIDATAPEIGWRYAKDSLRGALGRPTLSCPLVDLVAVGDRQWHVVDANLRSWGATLVGGKPLQGGRNPVYVPETGKDGSVLLDERGFPRVLREDGVPVDDVLADELVVALGAGAILKAVDLAGNQTVVPVLPMDEEVLPLGAHSTYAGCEFLVKPQVEPEPALHALRPRVILEAGGTLHSAPEDRELRLRYQPVAGGAAAEAPLPSLDFEALGLDLVGTYRGWVVGNGSAGEVRSFPFLFRPCGQFFLLGSAPPEAVGKLTRVDFIVAYESPLDPIVGGWITVKVHEAHTNQVVFSQTVTMTLGADGTLRASALLPVRCPQYLSAEAKVKGASGTIYGDDGVCRRLRIKTECNAFVRLKQTPPDCGRADPDHVQVEVSAGAFKPSRVDVETGPADAPLPLGSFELGPNPGTGHPYLGAWSLDIGEGRPDGEIPVRARLVSLEPELVLDKDALQAVIDRAPPAFQVLLPPENGALCVQTDAAGDSVTLLGEVADRSLPIKLRGTLASDLSTATPLELELSSKVTVTPLRFTANGLPDGLYTARFEVCDGWGNQGVVERHFKLSRQPTAFPEPTVTRRVFSPNGDGLSDSTTVTLHVPEALQLSAVVRQGSAAGPVVRTLLVDVSQAGATFVPVDWDGRDDGGTVVPDGAYFVVFSGRNACDGATSIATKVEVDNTPPTAVLTWPPPEESVGGSVDVLGTAEDAHFGSFALEFGEGDAPSAWTPLASGTTAVAGGRLGRWDTPQTPGRFTLRLRVLDQAQNSAEARVGVNVSPGELLARMSVTPVLFSPNGDTRRETTTLEYALKAAANVRLEVRTPAGATRRTLVAGLDQADGVYAQVWDGKDDAGEPVPDGDYVAFIRGEAPGTSQEISLEVAVDRTPPTVAVLEPTPGSVVARDKVVVGTATDVHLAQYALTATPSTGDAIELAQGTAPRTATELATLVALGDDTYQLALTAKDLAENEASTALELTVDATPPAVALVSPAAGALLSKDPSPIPVTGHVSDAHLDQYALSFGSGPSPLSLVPIATGATGGAGTSLGAWSVASLPDGKYTLVLEAKDETGARAEDRVTVTLDGTPPVAQLVAPAEGSFVTEPVEVTGTASDAQLESWRLEFAPGSPDSAYQWTVVATGSTNVDASALAQWTPLPKDGPHTLRLTASDALGRTSSALRSVTVDTTPPKAPEPRASVLRTALPDKADVALTWKAGPEPDLAGYRVFRGEAPLTSELLTDTAFTDAGRPEGSFTYHVLAVDHAGLPSPRGSVSVRVDLTPPTVAFSSPAEGARVVGAVEVRGTAASGDDFKEYRLFVGAGTDPASWTLLRVSTIAVTAGVLGEWLAFGDGPYVLALEAEDTSGNQARVTRSVVVDSLPPPAPTLVAVNLTAGVPDRLTPEWLESSAEDLLGYLVYRNGSLANAPGLVLGDLRPYVVPGLTYADSGLPDGTHCYRIVAADEAGNYSAPSNEICRSLDNRPPHAVIVAPPTGTRFGFPIDVQAVVADLDVASVQFQIRRQGEVSWRDLGPADASAPFGTTLDPASLSPGPYELRAVATDQASRTDPAPQTVLVVYRDVTPPEPPTGLQAKTDGSTVVLTWNANTEPDLSGYRLSRDGAAIAALPLVTTYTDTDVAKGPHEYVLKAVDNDGNLSGPSGPALALVYALSLDTPDFPVVLGPAAGLTGSGAQPNTTVRILRDGSEIAEAAATADRFQVTGVPLLPEANRLAARGEDAKGNRSLTSEKVLLISNSAPGPITGLAPSVDDHDVTLSWDPAPEADLFGYAVRRAEQWLTGSSPPEGYDAVEATDGEPAFALDESLLTAWRASTFPAALTVAYPADLLLERIALAFDPTAEGPVADYAVEALWQDEWVRIAGARGNESYLADHELPSGFAARSLRIVFFSPGALAELLVLKRDLVPAGTTTFAETGLPDGVHAYAVFAVDRYGAFSPAAEAEVGVGDATAPARPTGLVATVIGRDVQLTWEANPEPDLSGYVVLRDGARIARVPVPNALDPGLPNGVYTYTVLPVDAAGNESAESDPATAVVDVAPSPPGTPVITHPTDAAHPMVLETATTEVAGHADPGSLVGLRVNGVERAFGEAGPGLLPGPAVAVPAAAVRALSRDGTKLAFVTEEGGLEVRDLSTGGAAAYSASQEVVSLVFSPSADKLAYLGAERGLFVVDLQSGGEEFLEGGVTGFDWSPTGDEVVLARAESETAFLQALNPVTFEVRPLAAAAGAYSVPRFSPDGQRIAFVRTWLVSELRVVDASGAGERVLDAAPLTADAPTWSSDGKTLAYGVLGTGPRLRIRAVETGAVQEIVPAAGTVAQPQFAPEGPWLAYIVDEPGSRRLFVSSLAPGSPTLTRSGVVSTQWTAQGLAAFRPGRLAFLAPHDGVFRFEDVALAPGENQLVAWALDPEEGLAGPDSETVRLTVAGDGFPDLEVVAAEQTAFPSAPVAGQAAELRLRVRSVGAQDAPESALRVRLSDAAGAVVLDQTAELQALPTGSAVVMSVPWTPAAAGAFRLEVTADAGEAVVEADEANNTAIRDLAVTDGGGLQLRLEADATSYPAESPVRLTVRLLNGGTAFEGTATTTVEDGAGTTVATLDRRPVSLAYGETLAYTLPWNTGTTWAGPYAFRARLAGGATAEAALPFTITAALQAAARLTAERTRVAEGEAARFAARVENRTTNAPLQGAVARFKVRPAAGGAPLFEATRGLPALVPGAVEEKEEAWPVAAPAGTYVAELLLEHGGVLLASAQSSLVVTGASAEVKGSLEVAPAHVLEGEPSEAQVVLTNTGTAPALAYPVAVEIVDGTGTALVRRTAEADVPQGAPEALALPLPTFGLFPARYAVRLRGGVPEASLDRTEITVHGLIAPPSIDAPASGSTVATEHPVLSVNNAVSPEGAALFYLFELYADAALTMPLPGTDGAPETPLHTGWRVETSLAEDATFYWRARATDGFSWSGWTEVASFTVDAENRPPTAPVPQWPPPGASIAPTQPRLTVANGLDPEGAALTYEFRVASDPEMQAVLASASGLPEGLGQTGWQVPIPLDLGATYYWSARVSDGVQFSVWSSPASFMVDATNGAPGPPPLVRPRDGAEAPTALPALVFGHAVDPEDDLLTYRVEVDRSAGFDSPDRQASGELEQGLASTSWTPPLALSENTSYYWRAAATDGRSPGPWAVTTFFVNEVNEPPGVPVLLEPVAQTVGTATPALKLRNTVDPDGDTLTYDFVVRDAASSVVAEVTGAPAGAAETTWTVTPALAEDADYTWTARASDGALAGEWSAPAAFRVNAVLEPPTAPIPVAPEDGATVGVRQPTLTVENATSPEGLPLTYAFELYVAGGPLVEQRDGLAEGAGTTSWIPTDELPDGAYEWRARAHDGTRAGPWSATAHFQVLVDPPPAAPTGLSATPGDARVSLSWNASPEPDVIGYRVYRAMHTGPPYTKLGATLTPAFEDTGLTNGVTVFYVVTAEDARSESPYSAEVAATPTASTTPLPAEVRARPDRVSAECLLPDDDDDDDDDEDDDDDDHDDDDEDEDDHLAAHRLEPAHSGGSCPKWVYLTAELGEGYSSEDIELASVRLLGALVPDPKHHPIVDRDGDGVPEREFRFRLRALSPHLHAGFNSLELTGRVAGRPFAGAAAFTVTPLEADLRVTPRTLSLKSKGEDVQARLTFPDEVDTGDIVVSSVRLNESVPVKRVVKRKKHELRLAFDRAAVQAVLSPGDAVEIRVSGPVGTLAFLGVDCIRVIP